MDRARNTFLSGGARHSVLIDLPPDLPRALADRRRIVQVLKQPVLQRLAARPGIVAHPGHRGARGAPTSRSRSPTRAGASLRERLANLFRKHTGLTGGDREGALGAAGLGLAICKGLVEAHGGRIRAASGGAGQGTQITFTLPVAEVAGEDAAPGVARVARPQPGTGRSRYPSSS